MLSLPVKLTVIPSAHRHNFWATVKIIDHTHKSLNSVLFCSRPPDQRGCSSLLDSAVQCSVTVLRRSQTVPSLDFKDILFPSPGHLNPGQAKHSNPQSSDTLSITHTYEILCKICGLSGLVANEGGMPVGCITSIFLCCNTSFFRLWISIKRGAFQKCCGNYLLPNRLLQVRQEPR